jgi:hypothetical protein
MALSITWMRRVTDDVTPHIITHNSLLSTKTMTSVVSDSLRAAHEKAAHFTATLQKPIKPGDTLPDVQLKEDRPNYFVSLSEFKGSVIIVSHKPYSIFLEQQLLRFCSSLVFRGLSLPPAAPKFPDTSKITTSSKKRVLTQFWL